MGLVLLRVESGFLGFVESIRLRMDLLLVFVLAFPESGFVLPAKCCIGPVVEFGVLIRLLHLGGGSDLVVV